MKRKCKDCEHFRRISEEYLYSPINKGFCIVGETAKMNLDANDKACEDFKSK